ncbi:hypothetical protein G7Z17_g9724 [Cylindrodendrum hubeiense]|uniref:Zn(2)-C6 fungal-type domain-containing protein n=1 Tax=Cylindrodendrum hubeiense TaxID=595255 RepID=A0A9P5L7V7_9HYPO|nr:hypothetical protein G7Z17_g9724 [Cylindrodendrum hubeiense]
MQRHPAAAWTQGEPYDRAEQRPARCSLSRRLQSQGYPPSCGFLSSSVLQPTTGRSRLRSLSALRRQGRRFPTTALPDGDASSRSQDKVPERTCTSNLAPWLPCFPTVRVIIPHPTGMHAHTKAFQNGHLNHSPPLNSDTRWVLLIEKQCTNERPFCQKCIASGRECEGYERERVFITGTPENMGRVASHPKKAPSSRKQRTPAGEGSPGLDLAPLHPLTSAWDDHTLISSQGIEYSVLISALQTKLPYVLRDYASQDESDGFHISFPPYAPSELQPALIDQDLRHDLLAGSGESGTEQMRRSGPAYFSQFPNHHFFVRVYRPLAIIFHRCIEYLHRIIFQPVIDAYPNMWPDLPPDLQIDVTRYQHGREFAADICRGLDSVLDGTVQPDVLVAPMSTAMDFYREINSTSQDGLMELMWLDNFRSRLVEKGQHIANVLQRQKWVEVATF